MNFTTEDKNLLVAVSYVFATKVRGQISNPSKNVISNVGFQGSQIFTDATQSSYPTFPSCFVLCYVEAKGKLGNLYLANQFRIK